MPEEHQRALNPVVLTAIKVFCEASEDEVMNALQDFRVAHARDWRLCSLRASPRAGRLQADGRPEHVRHSCLGGSNFWRPAGPDRQPVIGR